ncbi:MAG: hypothetical protein WBY84_01500, partial [Pseudolabrys sp.]
MQESAVEDARTGNLCGQPGKGLARKRYAIDLTSLHSGDGSVNTRHCDKGRLGRGPLGRPQSRGIRDTADTHAGFVESSIFA